MAVNQHKNNHEEEVDLGTLFQIIGRGFAKFFNFIGSIFKGIFHFLIISLIFLKTNYQKIGIALLLGLISGYFLEVNKVPVYQSEMLIQPNFNSARQLYNNINYYNDLVKQKEYGSLASLFNLNEERAASLKGFEIEPIVVENDIIEAYDQLIISIDTATVRSYDYELFKNSFTNFDYKTHRINVVAAKNDVFKSVGATIVSSLEDHEYFKKVKSIYNENTKTTDSLYKENLAQIDSLRKVYMKVLIEQAKKETTGTSIDMRSEQRRAKELELFDVNRKVSEELKTLVKEKSEGFEVVNVISDFQERGNQLRGVTQNYIFLLGFGFAGLMIVFLLLLKLNRFLDQYQKV